MNKAMTPQKTMMRRHKGYAFLPTATFMLTFILVTALAIVAFLTLRKFFGFDIADSAATLAAISGAGISIAGSFAAVLLAIRSLQQGDRTFELERRSLNFEAETTFRTIVLADIHEGLEAIRKSSDEVVSAVDDLSRVSNVSYLSLSPQSTSGDSLEVCQDYSIEEREIIISSISQAQERLHQNLYRFLGAYDHYRSNELISCTLKFKSLRRSFEDQSSAKRVSDAIEDAIQTLTQNDLEARAQFDVLRKKQEEEFKKQREEFELPQGGLNNSDYELSGSGAYLSALEEGRKEWISERKSVSIKPDYVHSVSVRIAEFADEIRTASPLDLVARRAVVRFASEIASRGAIFDFQGSGGFHLEVIRRGKWTKQGLTRKFEPDLIEDSLLDVASWLDLRSEVESKEEVSPSLKFHLISSECPIFFFPELVGKADGNRRKGGNLPKRAVYLNEGAFTLIKAIGDLPNGRDIKDFLEFSGSINSKLESKQGLDQFDIKVLENINLPSGNLWINSLDHTRIDREMNGVFSGVVSDLSFDIGRSFLPLVSDIPPYDQRGENRKIDAARDLRFGLGRKRDLKRRKRRVAREINNT